MSKHISMCFPQQLPSNKTTTPTKIFRKWEISVCFSVSWCWHRMQLTPFCLMLSEYKIQHLRIFWTILYNFFFLIIHHYPCLHFYFLNTAFIRSLINYFRSVFFFGCCFFGCFFNFHPFLVSFSLPSFPTACLQVNPDRSQFFRYDNISLSCGEQLNNTGWKVKRKTLAGGTRPCSSGWGYASSGSTCIIGQTYPPDSGVYWCESVSGEQSNVVNITITGMNNTTLSSAMQHLNLKSHLLRLII